MEEATRQASAAAAASASSSPPAAGNPGITPEMKQMMLSSAKMAISAAPNAEIRQMIIEQYRLAGIPIDEKGNPLD